MARAARRPRRRRHRPHRAGGHAALPPALRGPAARGGPRRRHPERGRRRRGHRPDPRAPRLRPAQARRARVAHRGRRDLLPEPVRTHRRLQGDARRGAGRAVLRRPRRRAHHQLDRAGAQPLLHQHVPGVEPRAPVPLPRAQRRDQHAARQPQLDGRARVDARHRRVRRGRARPAVPDRHPGRQRLGDVRRGARAAAPRRAHAAARGADDDPRGVGEPRRDGHRAARLLPLPLDADGGLGRPGARGLHRRLGDRRGARPQRPASRPLLGHRGRARRPGLRGRRARHRPVDDRAQGPPRARPHVPRRHRRAPDRRRRRDQGRARRRAPLRRVAARRDGRARRPAVAVPRQVRPPRARAPPADLRLHRRGGLAAAAPDGAERRRGHGLDGQRRPARAVLVAQPRAVRLLHPALRAGHQPAAGRLPRGARHLAAGAPRVGDQPARRLARVVPARRAADAGGGRRRARAARRHQRRRRHARLRARTSCPGSTTSRAAGTRCAPG